MKRSNFLKLLSIGALIPFVLKQKSNRKPGFYIFESESPGIKEAKQENRWMYRRRKTINYSQDYTCEIEEDTKLTGVYCNGVKLHPSQYKIEGTLVTIL